MKACWQYGNHGTCCYDRECRNVHAYYEERDYDYDDSDTDSDCDYVGMLDDEQREQLASRMEDAVRMIVRENQHEAADLIRGRVRDVYESD